MAYVFDPEEDELRKSRPIKRRCVSKQTTATLENTQDPSSFLPLLDGTEKSEFVQLRESLFHESWAKVDGRIQVCIQRREIENVLITKEHLERLVSGNARRG